MLNILVNSGYIANGSTVPIVRRVYSWRGVFMSERIVRPLVSVVDSGLAANRQRKKAMSRGARRGDGRLAGERGTAGWGGRGAHLRAAERLLPLATRRSFPLLRNKRSINFLIRRA